MVKLWASIFVSISDAIWEVFSWFDQLTYAIPGSWRTIISFFVMLSVTRFIMGSMVGTVFGSGAFGSVVRRGSDTVRKRKED